MGFATYADVLRNPVVRRILWLGVFVRVPFWAANIAITLHIVTHLHRSYVEAGLVAAVGAVTLGISGPWRGRRLDQLGVRRAIAPSIVVLAVTWAIAPWLGYWPLLAFSALAGLWTIPVWSIIRTVLIGAVREDQRTTALSLDAIATELTYMVGPVLGVIVATTLPTPLALFLCEIAALMGGVLMWWVNPPLQQVETSTTKGTGLRLTAPLLAVLAMSIASIVILTGEDLGTVAAMRFWEHPGAIGWVLGLWGFGSAVGGLIYGAMHKPPSAGMMLFLLGLTTVVITVAREPLGFTGLLILSGAFCAPTITATTAALAHLVPAANRGEAMGWHGAAMMAGSALGAPLIGFALDQGGWRWGLLVAGSVGLAIAAAGIIATGRRAATEDEPELALESA